MRRIDPPQSFRFIDYLLFQIIIDELYLEKYYVGYIHISKKINPKDVIDDLAKS